MTSINILRVCKLLRDGKYDDLEPSLRGFDAHTASTLSDPTIHALGLPCTSYYTSRASWRDYLTAPRISPFRSTYLTTCIYLPTAAEVLAPSFAYFSIIDFDVPRLPEDSRFVARYGDSLRSMHVQDLRVTSDDAGGFLRLSRALSPFRGLQGVCLTLPTWNNFYHFLLVSHRNIDVEHSGSGVLPLSVCTLSIAIATAGGDVSFTENLAESLLVSHLRVPRLVDIQRPKMLDLWIDRLMHRVVYKPDSVPLLHVARR